MEIPVYRRTRSKGNIRHLAGMLVVLPGRRSVDCRSADVPNVIDGRNLCDADQDRADVRVHVHKQVQKTGEPSLLLCYYLRRAAVARLYSSRCRPTSPVSDGQTSARPLPS